eukprot:GEMP01057394.1.p1 GENE.GEMP01057394.1~~GEMP01057394.1.p1  ORF type:complete len:212 (-),score=24.60 GEMP01057394.1:664-1299(-)
MASSICLRSQNARNRLDEECDLSCQSPTNSTCTSAESEAGSLRGIQKQGSASVLGQQHISVKNTFLVVDDHTGALDKRRRSSSCPPKIFGGRNSRKPRSKRKNRFTEMKLTEEILAFESTLGIGQHQRFGSRFVKGLSPEDEMVQDFERSIGINRSGLCYDGSSMDAFPQEGTRKKTVGFRKSGFAMDLFPQVNTRIRFRKCTREGQSVRL